MFPPGGLIDEFNTLIWICISQFQTNRCSRLEESKWPVFGTCFELCLFWCEAPPPPLRHMFYPQRRPEEESEGAKGCWPIPLTRSLRSFSRWMKMLLPQTLSVVHLPKVNLHRLSSPFPTSLPGIVVVALFASVLLPPSCFVAISYSTADSGIINKTHYSYFYLKNLKFCAGDSWKLKKKAAKLMT